MAVTYEPIATTTLGSAQASVTFSSISGSYTDLVLVMTPLDNTAGGANVYMEFNGDTGTNYSLTKLEGNGSAASSARETNKVSLQQIGVFDNAQSTTIIQIMNYSNSTTHKSVLSRSGTAGGYVRAVVGLWRSTAAITSIKLTNDTTNFEANSTFTLYGIKAA